MRLIVRCPSLSRKVAMISLSDSHVTILPHFEAPHATLEALHQLHCAIDRVSLRDYERKHRLCQLPALCLRASLHRVTQI